MSYLPRSPDSVPWSTPWSVPWSDPSSDQTGPPCAGISTGSGLFSQLGVPQDHIPTKVQVRDWRPVPTGSPGARYVTSFPAFPVQCHSHCSLLNSLFCIPDPITVSTVGRVRVRISVRNCVAHFEARQENSRKFGDFRVACASRVELASSCSRKSPGIPRIPNDGLATGMSISQVRRMSEYGP